MKIISILKRDFGTLIKGLNYLFLFTILFMTFIYSTGCSKNNTLARLSPEVQWQSAEENFHRGRYTKAIPFYQQIILERSSVFTADAQFRLAESYFLRGGREDFIDAIFEYQEYLRLFPDQEFTADAQYRIAQSYAKLSLSAHFTQDDTQRAIENFTRFVERNPQDRRVIEAYEYIAQMQIKIIEKVYQNGYIYFKMKDYPASELYLKEIIELGNRNELEKKSMYYIALIHIDRLEEAEAKQALRHLETHFPNSKETKQIQKRVNRMNSWFFRLFYMI